MEREQLTIAVIGLGHVGLPTALGLAELGWRVVGADDDVEKADRIARGEMPFYEPQADALLREQLRSGRFHVASDVPAAVAENEVLFVCVGTPQRTDGSADLSQVEVVARVIARNLNGYKLIVEKSTSPVHTAEQIRRTIHRHRNDDRHFEVAVSPEFLREGSALHDFFHPDRLVFGVESDRAKSILLEIYRPLLERLDSEVETPSSYLSALNSRVAITSLATAELIKHAANAFLATKISFINILADLCEAAGADVTEVARGMGMDPRIGPHFLQAGIGFGGYCLPKDLRAFIHVISTHGLDASLLEEVERVNDRRIERCCEKVRQALWVVRGKTIGVLGLAFKPGTDDIREAPSLKIIGRLLGEEASLRLHDPQAMPSARQLLLEHQDRLTYCSSPYEAAAGSDALLLLTEWDEYRTLDLSRIRRAMETPILVDGRNLFDPREVRELGFEYYGIGR